jgi:DNA gyrase subunit A
MVITDGGQVIRTRVAEIRETGRNTQGVRVIRLKDGERVVDVEPLSDEEDDGEQDQEGQEGQGSLSDAPGEDAPEAHGGAGADGGEAQGDDAPAGSADDE